MTAEHYWSLLRIVGFMAAVTLWLVMALCGLNIARMLALEFKQRRSQFHRHGG